MLSLSNLQAVKKQRKKRVGRGNASGHGTYSTRGMKGQRSRTGGRKGLLKKGFKNILRRLPKYKGFRSLKPQPEIINLKELDKYFNNGDFIKPVDYKNKGLIKNLKSSIKILGAGELKKKLKVGAHQFSKTARAAIIKAGGEVIFLKK